MTFISLLPQIFTNVKSYGALGNGTADDTTAITNALNSLSSTGGVLFFPPGTYLSGNQTLLANVHIWGAGIGATVIKLKNGANADLFSANTANINLSGTFGAGSTTGTNFWGFHNLTLDGNKANQTGGPSYPVRAYGYGHIFEHVEIRSGYSGGILVDWNGGANPTAPNDAFMPHWYDVMVHDTGGIGIEFGGPTDTQWIAVNGYASASHVVHIGPNAIALRMALCHFWAAPVGVSACTVLAEVPELVLSNCQFEGSDTCALVVLGSDFQASALELGNTGDATRQGRGLQLGQNAGNTPYPGQVYQSAGVTTSVATIDCNVAAKFFECRAGALDEENTSGNLYQLIAYQGGGAGISSNSGYPVASSSGFLKVIGLTADGTPSKGGFFQVANGSFYGMQVYNTSGSVMYSIDTYDSVFQLKNGFSFSGYSDNGSTLKYSLNATNGNAQFNGQVSFGQSSSAAAIASSGTITTANVTVARVAPTGNVTGIILAAGTVAGQKVVVVNESSFTLTMAASGTSHVADGTSDVIAATTARSYYWDGGTSLWYRSA